MAYETDYEDAELRLKCLQLVGSRGPFLGTADEVVTAAQQFYDFVTNTQQFDVDHSDCDFDEGYDIGHSDGYYEGHAHAYTQGCDNEEEYADDTEVSSYVVGFTPNWS